VTEKVAHLLAYIIARFISFVNKKNKTKPYFKESTYIPKVPEFVQTIRDREKDITTTSGQEEAEESHLLY